MKTCLAVMAHESAGPTIADFQPRWEKLGLPILAFVPEGHAWPGVPVAAVHAQGESAHGGEPVFRRFLTMCETLLDTDFDRFLVMEYDTVNLGDTFPAHDPKAITAGFMKVTEHGCPGGNYLIALSPWIFTRPILSHFCGVMRHALRRPLFPEWMAGLLDRWLAVAMIENNLPLFQLSPALPFPFHWLNPLQYIADHPDCIVHGYKRLADLYPSPTA
jgi:hypothetical protein